MSFNWIKRLLGAGTALPAADKAYHAIVNQSRLPDFYAGGGVPDNVNGRFDMVVLHAFLLFHRLQQEASAARFSQAVFDIMFKDMDCSLREMGTGDLGVAKKIKKMVSIFYGRSQAYGQAIEAGNRAALGQALGRNIFDDEHAAGAGVLADYVLAQAAALQHQQVTEILSGRIRFGPVSRSD